METVSAKTIVTRTKKPSEWFGTDYTMNIYRGCSHGCIYCDSRSDCYREVNFDTVKVKEDALRIIRDDLRRKVKSGVIATGAMSDPYNPFEQKLELTRNALNLIHAFGFGVFLSTKSDLVRRDIDILSDIKGHSPVMVSLSITTCDDHLAQKIEPYAPLPRARFAALEELAKAGIFCGILAMPILPFLSDTEENVVALVTKAKAAGAHFIYPSFGVTLRPGNREYFYDALDKNFPQLREKYSRAYGERYFCQSQKAKKLWDVFTKLCQENELLYDMKSIIRMYQHAYESPQLSFLD